MGGSVLYDLCLFCNIFLIFVISWITSIIHRKFNLLKSGYFILFLLISSYITVILSTVLYVLNVQIFLIYVILILYSSVCIFLIFNLRLKYLSKIPSDILIQQSDDIIIILDSGNRIQYFNNSASFLFDKRNVKELYGASITDLLPEIIGIITKMSGKTGDIELNSILYETKLYKRQHKNGKIIYKALFLRDISKIKKIKESMVNIEQELGTRVSERTEELEKTNTALLREIDEHRKSEMRLKSSLEEKNILLSEVHHRVKNNLQVINSLLKLQTKYIKDESALNFFNTAVSRIRSIAMIHEKLYKSENISNTNFDEYIHELAQYLISSHRKDSNSVKLNVNVKNIFLDIDSSVLCGLIINELILNALKYAFPEGNNSNEITINFISTKKTKDDIYGTGFGFELTVMDNGIGFPDDFDIEKSETLGFKIISTLVKQLKGTMDFKNDNGAVIIISF